MATSDSPLNVPNVTLAVARGAPGPSAGETIWGPFVEIDQPEAAIFSDDFSAGDLSHTENGAGWTGQTATSLVDSNGCVIFTSGGAVLDPPSCGFESRQWEGWLNNIALRFRYGVDAQFPMQEWSLNEPVTKNRDIWFRIPMRVPQGYRHVNNSGSSTNNKFFALIQDGRETNSDGGATVVFQTYPSDSPGNVGSKLKVYVWNSSAGNGDKGEFLDFWSVPEVEGNGQRDDRLRWMDIVLHCVSNTAGAGTGKIQAWRRWQDSGSYDLMMDITTDVPLPNSGYDAWNRVQIIGGDNSWIDEGTEILMDGFYVSDQPLVPAGTEGL